MKQNTILTKKIEESGQVGVADSVVAMVTLIVGVAIAILMLIFTGALAGQTWNLVEPDIESIGNTAVVNSSFTAINGSAVSLGNVDVHSGSLVVLNDSVGVGLGNFTVDYPAGTATLLNNAFNNTALDASYNYGDLTIQNSVEAAVTSGFEALEQTGNYLPLIVLAVITALIIGIILSFANFGTQKVGGGSVL